MTASGKNQGSERRSDRIRVPHPDRLQQSTVTLLRDRLGPSGAATAFAEAVTLQVARSAAVRGESAEVEDGVALRVVEILRSSRQEDKAALLASDRVLLSSFFQNVDLLYAQGYSEADAVSLLIMRALEIADPYQ